MFDKEKNKKKIIISAIIGLVVVLTIIKIMDNYFDKNNKDDIKLSSFISEEKEVDETETIKVYITGEVVNEGVIELEEGSRIADAIEKAGGKTENANIKNVNLAYALEDGQKIYIPNKEEANIEIIEDGAEGIVEENNTTSSVVNINKADIGELQTLNGIGESLATSIVKYREENGNFKDIEELKNVPGIGESKFESIKDSIKVK